MFKKKKDNIMKRLIISLLFCLVAICFVVSFYSCSNKDKHIDEPEVIDEPDIECSCCEADGEAGGEVSYKYCPHEEEVGIEFLRWPYTPPHLTQGEAYFFRDSIPEQMMNQINNEINSPPYPTVVWIIHYSKIADSARLFSEKNYYPEIRRRLWRPQIINFPDFTKEWENGCKVYFEGLLHYECNECYPISLAVVIENYVLTCLKIKNYEKIDN